MEMASMWIAAGAAFRQKASVLAPIGLMAALPTGASAWADLMRNQAFVAGFLAWLVAQVTTWNTSIT